MSRLDRETLDRAYPVGRRHGFAVATLLLSWMSGAVWTVWELLNRPPTVPLTWSITEDFPDGTGWLDVWQGDDWEVVEPFRLSDLREISLQARQ